MAEPRPADLKLEKKPTGKRMKIYEQQQQQQQQQQQNAINRQKKTAIMFNKLYSNRSSG